MLSLRASAFFVLFVLLVETSGKAPNIVILLADDLGWNDVGFHGSKQVKTPVIDSMASSGIILNNYYTLPLCSPSRASLMTGRHAVRTGLQFGVIRGGQPLGLPLNFKIMPQWLNDLGYESHAIGKWHLGLFHRNYTPSYRGFKSYYGYYNGRSNYFDHRGEIPIASKDPNPEQWFGLDWHLDEDGNLSTVNDYFGQYSTHLIANRTNYLIEKHNFEEKPLFLYVAFQSAHSGNRDDSVQVPQETEYEFKDVWNVNRRKFVGVVNEMDTAIGQIKDALEKQGVLDNTIILFSTDNGGANNDFDENWASNYPLRGGKQLYFEGGIRGSAFIYGDMFKSRAGQVSSDLIHISDWLPTFYEAAGGNLSELGDIDSYSVYKVLTGDSEKSPREDVLVNIDPYYGSKGIIKDRFKYVYKGNGGANSKWDNWFQAPGKYPNTNETITPNTTAAQVYCGDVPQGVDLSCHSQVSQQQECMFDLENDPCEFYNLIDDEYFNDKKQMLLERLAYWETMQVPFLFPPSDPAGNPEYHDWGWKPWTNDPTIPPNIEIDFLINVDNSD